MAITLVLAVGSGQCCSNAKAGTVQPAASTHAESTKQTMAAEAGTTKTVKAPPEGKAAAPQLDMNALIERLKQTQAIGVLTKLVLRSNVNDLIGEVKRYKKAKGTAKQLARIKAHFNGLLLKVLTLLDEDPKLAEDIQCARANLWKHLMEVNV
jgi:hypothetical protein